MVKFKKSIGERTAERERAKKEKIEKMRKENEDRELAGLFKPSFATKSRKKRIGTSNQQVSGSKLQCDKLR